MRCHNILAQVWETENSASFKFVTEGEADMLSSVSKGVKHRSSSMAWKSLPYKSLSFQNLILSCLFLYPSLENQKGKRVHLIRLRSK